MESLEASLQENKDGKNNADSNNDLSINISDNQEDKRDNHDRKINLSITIDKKSNTDGNNDISVSINIDKNNQNTSSSIIEYSEEIKNNSIIDFLRNEGKRSIVDLSDFSKNEGESWSESTIVDLSDFASNEGKISSSISREDLVDRKSVFTKSICDNLQANQHSTNESFQQYFGDLSSINANNSKMEQLPIKKNECSVIAHETFFREDALDACANIDAHTINIMKDMSSEERRPLMSIVVGSATKSQMEQLLGTSIANDEWTKARKHSIFPGPGYPVPSKPFFLPTPR